MSLTTRTLLALGLGFVVGVVMVSLGLPKEHVSVTTAEVVGGLWLDALRMTIIPLVFSLVVTGVASTAGMVAAGTVTRVSLALFFIIMLGVALLDAAVVPWLLSVWPTPSGSAEALRHSLGSVREAGEYPGIAAMLRGFIPPNVVSAAASGAMLPLVFFALVFGFALTKVDQGQSFRLTDVFVRLKEAMLVVVGWVLLVAPVGVFALALVVGARTGFSALGAFAHYIAIYVIMCLIGIAAAYPVASLIGGVSPGRFAKAAAPAQAVALSTQSSVASLPAMIKTCEAHLGLPSNITGVTLPLAVTLFRIAGPLASLTIAIYAAHVMGVSVSAPQLAAGAIIAIIMVPAGGGGIPATVTFFATQTPILSAMGVPIEILGLLIAVETIPDMFRTTANVSMDMAVTTAVARLTRSTSAGQEVGMPRETDTGA
jgi:proton glutamate symport protein